MAHATRLNKHIAVQEVHPYRTHALVANEGVARRPLAILRTAPGAGSGTGERAPAGTADGDEWYLQLSKEKLARQSNAASSPSASPVSVPRGSRKASLDAGTPTPGPSSRLPSVGSCGVVEGAGAFSATPKKRHLPPVCAADDDPIARDLAGLIAEECAQRKAAGDSVEGSAEKYRIPAHSALSTAHPTHTTRSLRSAGRSRPTSAGSRHGGSVHTPADSESNTLPVPPNAHSPLPPLSHGAMVAALDAAVASPATSAGAATPVQAAVTPNRTPLSKPHRVVTPGIGGGHVNLTPPGTPLWQQAPLFADFFSGRSKPVPLAPVPAAAPPDPTIQMDRYTGSFFDWMSTRQAASVIQAEERRRLAIGEIETDMFFVWLWPMSERMNLQAAESAARNAALGEEDVLRGEMLEACTIYGGVLRQTAQAVHMLRVQYYSKLKLYVVIKKKASFLLMKEVKLGKTVKTQRRRWAWDKLFANVGAKKTHRHACIALEAREGALRAAMREEEAEAYEVFAQEVRRFGLIVWMIWRLLSGCPRDEEEHRYQMGRQERHQFAEIETRSLIERIEITTRGALIADFRAGQDRLTKLISLSLVSEKALFAYRWVTWQRYVAARLDMSSPEGRARVLRKRNTITFLHRFYTAMYDVCAVRRHIRRRHERALKLLYKNNAVLFRKAWAAFRKLSFRRVMERLLLRGTVLLIERYFPRLAAYKRLSPHQKRIWDMEQLRAANLNVTLSGYYRRLDAWCSRRVQQKMKVKILRYGIMRHLARRFFSLWVAFKDRKVLVNAVDALMTRADRLLLRMRWGSLVRHRALNRRDRRIIAEARVLQSRIRKDLRRRYLRRWVAWLGVIRQEQMQMCDAGLLEEQSLLTHRRMRYRLLLRHSRWRANIEYCARRCAEHMREHLAARFGVWLRWVRRRRRAGDMHTMASILEADSAQGLLVRYFRMLQDFATDDHQGRDKGVLRLLRQNQALLRRRYYTRLRALLDRRDARGAQHEDAVLLAELHRRRVLRRYWAALQQHAQWYRDG